MLKTFAISTTGAIRLECGKKGSTNALQGRFRICNIMAHSGITEAGTITTAELTVTNVSNRGTVYNTLIRKVSNWIDAVFFGEEREIYEDGDYPIIECSDTTNLKSIVVIIDDNLS